MFALRKDEFFSFIKKVLKAGSGAIWLALAKWIHCIKEISPILENSLASILEILVEFTIASLRILIAACRNDTDIHDILYMESCLAMKIQMIYI